MNFARLRLADWVALAAALALLLVMAIDWYTTVEGAALRRDSGLAISGAATHGQGPDLKGAYNTAANGFEKNAWQEHAAIDRLILIALLVAIGAAVIAAFMRAAGRRFGSGLTPSAVASFAGLAALLMLAYRILQPPGWNPGAVVKAGAPLALLCVTVLTLAERVAVHYEQDGTAWSRTDAEGEAPSAPAPAPGSPAS
jgi:hypothetical protein